MSDTLSPFSSEPLTEPLTKRELQILHLICEGKTNQVIAKELVITISTAKWHIHNIYRKLGIKRRIHAILRAKTLGLVGLPHPKSS